jgi:hypothetical protein
MWAVQGAAVYFQELENWRGDGFDCMIMRLRSSKTAGKIWKPFANTWKVTVLTSSACHRIQTWALEEARRRLEAEGILPDPSPPSLSGTTK